MSKQLDALISDLYDTRAAITEANKEVDALKLKRDDLEARLLEAMDAVGTEQARNKLATATITERVMPKITDWEKYYSFIHRNKAYYLLERRPASTAFRETLEGRTKPIPGAETYVKRTVGIRTRN